VNYHRLNFYKALFGTILISLLFTYCDSNRSDYLSEFASQIKRNFSHQRHYFYQNLMPGTKHETAVYRFQSESPNPGIIVIGGTHGDEPAGFEAAYRLLDYLSKNHPLKGTIYVIPEANKMAIIHGERRIPVPESVAIDAGDLNRCYPGRPEGLPAYRLAYQITEFIKIHQIQLLIDLHESPYFAHEIHAFEGEISVPGQCIIYTGNEIASRLSHVVCEHINQQISAHEKKFTLKEGPIENSAAWLAGAHFKIPGFTIETCKKLPLEKRIQFHLAITLNILKEMDIFQDSQKGNF